MYIFCVSKLIDNSACVFVNVTTICGGMADRETFRLFAVLNVKPPAAERETLRIFKCLKLINFAKNCSNSHPMASISNNSEHIYCNMA